MNRFKFIALLFCVLLLSVAFVGCIDAVDDDVDVQSFCKLIFEVDGTEYDSFEVKDLSALSLPGAPTKEGYVFDGWFLDKDVWTQPFSVDALINQPLSSDLKVYAKFSLIPEVSAENFVVSFDSGAGYTVSATKNGNAFMSGETVTCEDEVIFTISVQLGYKNGTLTADGTKRLFDNNVLSDVKEDVTVYGAVDYATDELPIVNIIANGAINSKENYTDMTFSLENVEDELSNVTGGIRLRGNSTMGYPKKPYRIKFDKKQSLFGLTKAKSWVLLADYLDPSCLHNHTAFTMGEAGDGLSFTPTSYKVNVYLNYEYVGLYTLCEQVQENEGRMDIEMETDDDDYIPTFTDILDYNFFICMDASTPSDATAVLGETYFYLQEYDRYFELKYPEKEAFKTEEQFNSFFQQLIEYTKNILGICANGNLDKIQEVIDINSLVDYYIVDAIMMERDHTYKSFNMYFTVESQKLSFGPIWDYDWSLNTPWTGFPNETFSVDTTSIYYSNVYFAALSRFTELQDKIKERYTLCFEEKLSAYIEGFDNMVNGMGDSLALNAQKWYSAYNYDITEANVSFLKDYLVNRKLALDALWLIEL